VVSSRSLAALSMLKVKGTTAIWFAVYSVEMRDEYKDSSDINYQADCYTIEPLERARSYFL